MIRSMTGFGGAGAQVDQMHYLVELRSLNNRYFKATMRLADPIGGLEPILEAALRKQVCRGSFALTVKMHMDADKAGARVNEAAVASYLKQIETINKKLGGQNSHVELAGLLSLPGVLLPSEDEDGLLARCQPVVLDLLGQAVSELKKMRVTEGQALAEDISNGLDAVLKGVEIVEARAPAVIDEYHQKLKTRIDQMAARASLNIDKKDLIREVALYADRADISEELSRLRGHLDQCQKIIDRHSEEPAGRTLDFICQELLREANTIASKSSDAQISRTTVEMKSAIDRIKEQVQNVE